MIKQFILALIVGIIGAFIAVHILDGMLDEYEASNDRALQERIENENAAR